MKKTGRLYLVLAFAVFVLLFGSVTICAQQETIIRAAFSWPTHIDPAVGSDASSSSAFTNLYDTLIYPALDDPIKPHLATSWEISADGMSYTFNLRKGVKFHDGTEFTAEDVKFSLDRLMAIGEGYAYIFKGYVDRVEVLDDYKVKFILKKSFGPFLSSLTRLYILNKDQVMANLKAGPYGEFGDYGKDWLNINDAGTGAYKVKEFSVGSYLLLEKFEDYFGEMAQNAPDYFKMIGSTDPVYLKTAMMRQELDIIDLRLTTRETTEFLEKQEGISAVKTPNGALLYVMLNTKKPPLDDVHVRKALSYAFDYQIVVEEIYPGRIQAVGPVGQVIPGWKKVYQYTMDLNKAKEELKKSKYYGQFGDYPIVFGANSAAPGLEKIGLLVMSDAARIGLNVEIQKLEWLQIIEKAASIETTPHMLAIWVSPHYFEAGSILWSKYHSSNTGTWEQTEWVQNEEIDRLIEAALVEVDREERMRLYGLVQEKITNEIVPDIFVYEEVNNFGYWSKYINWPDGTKNNPLLGYNYDVRFMEINSELRN